MNDQLHLTRDEILLMAMCTMVVSHYGLECLLILVGVWLWTWLTVVLGNIHNGWLYIIKCHLKLVGNTQFWSKLGTYVVTVVKVTSKCGMGCSTPRCIASLHLHQFNTNILLQQDLSSLVSFSLISTGMLHGFLWVSIIFDMAYGCPFHSNSLVEKL